MEIEDFIEKYKKKDLIYFFNNWGCYMFARMLQVNYGGVIYSNIDHCKLKLGSFYYDINGEIFNSQALDEWYIPIDALEEIRYKNYENFNIH